MTKPYVLSCEREGVKEAKEKEEKSTTAHHIARTLTFTPAHKGPSPIHKHRPSPIHIQRPSPIHLQRVQRSSEGLVPISAYPSLSGSGGVSSLFSPHTSSLACAKGSYHFCPLVSFAWSKGHVEGGQTLREDLGVGLGCTTPSHGSTLSVRAAPSHGSYIVSHGPPLLPGESPAFGGGPSPSHTPASSPLSSSIPFLPPTVASPSPSFYFRPSQQGALLGGSWGTTLGGDRSDGGAAGTRVDRV